MKFEFQQLTKGVFEFKNTAHGKSVSLRLYPRESACQAIQCVYILLDANKYCCYVGETENLSRRFGDHSRDVSKFWWKNAIVLYDVAKPSAFMSTDHRQWYEAQLFERLMTRHPTFTEKVHRNKEKPDDGDKVLDEILDLLDLVDIHLKAQPLPSSCNPQQGDLFEQGDARVQRITLPPSVKHHAQPSRRSDSNNDPPEGYPCQWSSCAEMLRELCNKEGIASVPGGWDAKFRRGVANAGKPSKTLKPILERYNLLENGLAPLWWRISRNFTLLPPPDPISSRN